VEKDPIMTIPFEGTIRQGDKGRPVRAVKRALARAGFGLKVLSQITSTFGTYSVKNLKLFQQKHGLKADGVYGASTHAKLTPYFDAYARQMYLGDVLILPEFFTPDHQTDGLPGYPALDILAPGGKHVGSPCDGTIRKHSGHQPTATVAPGGPYGWSIYVRSHDGSDFFLTHFGQRFTTVGQPVRRGEVIGTVADYARATGGVTPSHIHEGKHRP
jgi:murein DD-endopeptidase MepM/ murein hydrolase activator NlpD